MRPQLTLLIILFGLLSGPVVAQNAELLSFSEEVSVVGLDQEKLYEKAKVFFIDKYNNPDCPLKMNKNTGSVTGGGSETIDFSSKLKSSSVVMDYKIKMKLRENGYSLNITEFAYQESKRGKRNDKVVLSNKSNKDAAKKTKALQSKLKREASAIAQLIIDDIKREMYKQDSVEEIVNNNTSSDNTRW